MKKVMGNVKRTLSGILAAAMVVTMIPQTGLSVYAEEIDEMTSQTEVADGDEAVDDVIAEGDMIDGTLESGDTNQSSDGVIAESDSDADTDDGGLETDVVKSTYEEKTVSTSSDDDISLYKADINYSVNFSNGAGGGYEVSENAETTTTGQDYTFKVTPEKYYKNPTATASIGEGETAETVTVDGPMAGADGTYTFTITGQTLENIQTQEGTINVVVSVEEVAQHQLTVAAEPDVGVKEAKYALDEPDSEESWKDIGEGVSIHVGDTVYIQVEADEKTGYSIAAVTAKVGSDGIYETIDKPADKDYYQFTMTDEDLALIVTAEKESYEADTLNDDNIEECATAEITFSYEDVVYAPSILVDGEPLDEDMWDGEAKTATVPENNEITFTVNAKEDSGYRLVAVYVNTDDGEKEEVLEPNKDGVYSLGNVGEDITVTVMSTIDEEQAVTAKALEKNRDILFANKSAKLTYKVNTTNTGVSLKAGTSNTYAAEAGMASMLEFSVTASNGYKPVVSYTGTDISGSIPIPEDENRTMAGKNTTEYQYEVLISDLPEDVVISLGDQVQDASLMIIYKDDEVKIASARIGAKALEASEIRGDEENRTEQGDVNTHYVDIPHGETLTLVFEALDNCRITGAIQGTQQNGLKKVSTKAAGFEVSIKADALNAPYPQLDVSSEKLYRAEIYQGDDRQPLEAVKNVYTVDYDGTYTTKVRYGKDGFADFTIEVKNSSLDITEDVVSPVEGDNASQINLNESLGGKKLTVNLLVDGQKIADYSLNVLPAVTKVEVTGAKKVGGVNTITQTVDTVQEYAVKMTPKTANVGVVTAEVEEESGYKAELVNGVLTITIPQDVTKTAILKFYTVSKEGEKTPVPESDVALVNVNQLKESMKPTVKLTSSDDTTLTLTLDVPKGVVKPNQGTLYYAVNVSDAGAAKTTKYSNEEELAEIKSQITGENAALGPDGETSGRTWYVEVTDTTQNYTVKVNNAGTGKGVAWKYNVSVQLIQTKDATVDVNTAPENNFAYSDSFYTGTKPYETKNPYYEDNLKLTKGTTTIYTGQTKGKDDNLKGVLIATPKFSANTTYAKITHAVDATYDDITQYDVNGNVSSDGSNGALELFVDPDTCQIYAKAYYSYESDGKRTDVGKHKIIVYAEAAPGAQPAAATIDITVVKGIEGLSVTVPSTTLYKVDKKAATLKATVAYDGTPKAKKVTWEIVGENGETESAPAGITVKNGTVTVDKNYIVSWDSAKNTFRVKVTAADYTGNNSHERVRYALSDVITITDQAQPIGEVALLSPIYEDEKDSSSEIIGYTVLARNNALVTAEGLRSENGTYVKVLRKGTPETKKIAADDVLDSACFTFTSSNKAAVAINADGIVTVDKPAKNVKITATANDGSKSKSVMTFTVNYAATAEMGENALGLGIAVEEPIWRQNKNPDNSSEVVTFDGTVGTIVNVQVLKCQENGGHPNWGGWAALTDYTDFKVTAKNAKIFKTDGKFGDYMQLVTTKKDAEITLTYSYINGAGKSVKKTVTYKLVNTGYDTAGKGKAPKITLTGNVIANEYNDVQKLKGTISGLPNDVFKPDKKVHVEVDMSAASAKTLEAYEVLSNHLGDSYGNARDIDINRDGTFELTLREVDFDCLTDNKGEGRELTRTNIPAGTYKIKLTVGSVTHELDTAYQFVPEYQVATVTLKVTAPKAVKGSFKLTTSYSLSLADSNIVFAYTAKELKDLTFEETLCNANIKGTDNKFTTYFDVLKEEVENEDGDKINKVIGIQLQDSVIEALKEAQKKNPAATLADIIPVNDLTGYVVYTAKYGTDADGKPMATVTDTAKITVKLLSANNGAALKYAASNAAVLGDRTNVKAEIVITAGGRPQKLAFAYAVDKFGKVEGRVFTVEGECEGNVITLTSEDTPAFGAHKLDLYVVPEGSAAEYINAIEDSAEQQDAIMKYGVKLTPTITVNDPAKTTGKIKVLNTNVVLQNDSFDKDYHNYSAWAEYSMTGTCDIVEDHDGGELGYIRGITVASGVFADKMQFVKGTRDVYDDKGNIIAKAVPGMDISISKENLQELVGEKKNKLKYGQTVSVPVTILLESEGAAEGTKYKEEKVTFKVTLPKEASGESFQSIYDRIEADKDEIMNIPLPSGRDWANFEGEELYRNLNGVKQNIIDNLTSYVPGDGYAQLQYDDVVTENSCANVEYKRATDNEEGYIIVTLTLVNLERGSLNEESCEWSYDNDGDKELVFKISIPRNIYENTLDRIAGEVRSVVGRMSEDGILTNDSTELQIRNYLRNNDTIKSALEGTGVKLYTRDFGYEPATDVSAGSITLTVTLWDTEYDGYRDLFWNDWDGAGGNDCLKIPRLDGYEETVDKIQAALQQFMVTNKTTADELYAVINGAIANKDITTELASFDRNPASPGIAGAINVTYVLKNPKSESGNLEYGPVKCILNIEALTPVDEVIALVHNAAVTPELAKAYLESNDYDAVKIKAAIREAVNNAIAAEPYTVEFVSFELKPATWKEDGTIAYTLIIIDENGNTLSDIDGDLTLKENGNEYVVFAQKDVALQTAEEALEEVCGKVLDNSGSVADETLKSYFTPRTMFTSPDKIAEFAENIKNYLHGLISNQVIEVEIGNVISRAATFNEGGTYQFEFWMTKGDEISRRQKITLTCDKKEPTLQDAVDAVKGIDVNGRYIGYRDFATYEIMENESDRRALQATILNAAQKAVDEKVRADLYIVSIEEGDELRYAPMIWEGGSAFGDGIPRLNGDGNASITLTIREKNGEESMTVTFDCPIDIPQTDEEAFRALKDAVDGLELTEYDVSSLSQESSFEFNADQFRRSIFSYYLSDILGETLKHNQYDLRWQNGFYVDRDKEDRTKVIAVHGKIDVVRRAGDGIPEEYVVGTVDFDKTVIYHEHNYEIVNTLEATCETPGYTYYECSVCGQSERKDIPATGHSENDSWIIDYDATCTDNGLWHTECKVCGKAIRTAAITAKGHEMSGWHTITIVECEKDGLDKNECSNCDYYESRTISATGHDYGEWVVDKEPTEESEGLRHKVCKNCGGTVSENIERLPKHEHNFIATSVIDPTCTEGGYTIETCQTCGSTRKINETEPTGVHKEGKEIVVEEAKLGIPGQKEVHCMYCDLFMKSEEIPMLMTDGVDSVYYINVKGSDGEIYQKMIIGHYDDEMAAEMVEMVNDHREEIGQARLTVTDTLTEYAKIRARECGYSESHTRPTGSQTSYGENLAAGDYYVSMMIVPGTEEFFEAWMNSPGHRENLEGYKVMGETGVSCFFHRVGDENAPQDSLGRYAYRECWIQVFR